MTSDDFEIQLEAHDQEIKKIREEALALVAYRQRWTSGFFMIVLSIVTFRWLVYSIRFVRSQRRLDRLIKSLKPTLDEIRCETEEKARLGNRPFVALLAQIDQNDAECRDLGI